MSLTVTAAVFKATCLKLMDKVSESGETIVITKRGKPVARLTSCAPPPRPILGAMKGSIKITGDLIAPIDEEWEAQK